MEYSSLLGEKIDVIDTSDCHQASSFGARLGSGFELGSCRSLRIVNQFTTCRYRNVPDYSGPTSRQHLSDVAARITVPDSTDPVAGDLD